jgi:hypothetical protein
MILGGDICYPVLPHFDEILVGRPLLLPERYLHVRESDAYSSPPIALPVR